MLRRIRGQVIDVAAQSIMQIGAGLFARAFEQAQLRQRADDRCLTGGQEFGGRIAKIHDLFLIDTRAGSAKTFLPTEFMRLFPSMVWKPGKQAPEDIGLKDELFASSIRPECVASVHRCAFQLLYSHFTQRLS